MSIKLGKKETEFSKDNLIKENDNRFIELITFLKDDCKAKFINNKWTWEGDYEIKKGKKKYTYTLEKLIEEDGTIKFEIDTTVNKIKVYYYFTEQEIITKFFKADKSTIIKIDTKQREDNSINYRWRVEGEMDEKDLMVLKDILETTIIENVRNSK